MAKQNIEKTFISATKIFHRTGLPFCRQALAKYWQATNPFEYEQELISNKGKKMSLFILVLMKLKASYKEYSFRLELIYHI